MAASIRRAVRALSAAWLVAAVSPARAQEAADIHLPTREDAIASAAQIETLLNGKRALETQIPGPVVDRELVTVAFGPNGKTFEIEVVQRLRLSGLGDYSFKVPGPAIDVQGLPGSDAEPGLRRGAVLWQGFSPGTRTLGAILHLRPELELARLPLAVDLEMEVGGRPLRDEPLSGPFTLTLEIENRSAVPVTMPDAASDPGLTAAALDAARRALEAETRPVPGKSGLPPSLPMIGRAGSRTADIEAPFLVQGLLRFPSGTLEKLDHGGDAPVTSRGSGVRFEVELGGGDPTSRTIRVTGEAHDLTLPRLVLRAAPAPPTAGSVEPPGGGTWAAYAATHPDAESSRMMVGLLLETLWRTARLAQFDAYLGNPDIDGASSTAYTYELGLPPEVIIKRPVPKPELNALGVAVSTFAVLALLSGLALAWARS